MQCHIVVRFPNPLADGGDPVYTKCHTMYHRVPRSQYGPTCISVTLCQSMSHFLSVSHPSTSISASPSTLLFVCLLARHWKCSETQLVLPMVKSLPSAMRSIWDSLVKRYSDAIKQFCFKLYATKKSNPEFSAN